MWLRLGQYFLLSRWIQANLLTFPASTALLENLGTGDGANTVEGVAVGEHGKQPDELGGLLFPGEALAGAFITRAGSPHIMLKLPRPLPFLLL